MEREMEKEKNIIQMVHYNLKENIQMEKEMEKEKKLMIMVNYSSKVNIYIILN